ncbi:beta-1,4-glucuronyltransferase 1-like [Onthophagus taurus]|uniref:beta-1,4-glucuronyltransferase 1-like n=1 Tax=Onthophagus taurus TaxID=166361 RepID=UPI0039BE307B
MSYLKNLTKCENIRIESKFETVDDYRVFYNFIAAGKRFECDESITFATYARSLPEDLLRLEDAVSSFDGPFSIAVYLPGDQFYNVMEIISYLRRCRTKKIKKMVTFHLIFKRDDLPKTDSSSQLIKAFSDDFKCSESNDFKQKFKNVQNKKYPINLAENVAKYASQTHFIFSSRIDLIPPKNLVNSFFNMLKNHRDYYDFKPAIFVLPLFQIDENVGVPRNKRELKEVLLNGTGRVYLKTNCFGCKEINISDYLSRDFEELEGDFDVVSFDKKLPNLKLFYIGSKDEDEKNRFEDYNFLILNTFLIQK